MKLIKVAHLTSVHPRYDTRIFLKMCTSLAKIENYKISLVVADGNGDEIKNNVRIYDLGKPKNRVNRLLEITKKMYLKAKDLNSDIYHIHDPELIWVGLKLKSKGKKVIFDIHENISLQILDKEYLNNFLRFFISKSYRLYEYLNLKKFDYLILAENSYYKYYKFLNKKIEIILNMPDYEFLKQFESSTRNRNEIFYIGSISINRGIDVISQAISLLKSEIPDILVKLVGPYDESVIKTIKKYNIEKNVVLFGRLPLFEGYKHSLYSRIGIAILKPIGNYLYSYSTKIFEYMAIGLPVITSNFKIYKEIVEKNKCGLCVDPLNAKEIAEAIRYILMNPKEAAEMGANGKKAVFEKYNWSVEEIKLLKVYEELINNEDSNNNWR